VGAGHCNVRFSSLSALVWGLTLSNNLFGNFIIIFLISIASWSDVFQNPHLRQCKTLAVMLRDTHNQIEMKRLDKENIKDFIKTELGLYRTEFARKNYDFAFRHLERIHIVSQPFPIEHTLTHLRMLKFAFLTFKPIEILVQTLYSLFSFKFSMLNIFPQGNTGGANAIIKGQMTIPKDIKNILINKQN
jgi:hypothetical protein